MNCQIQQLDFCSGGKIANCPHLQGLKNVLDRYNKSINDIYKIQYSLQHILNGFLHLLHSHDNDDEFEYIVNTLKTCKVQACTIFERNYRDRSKSTYSNTKNNPHDVAECQILDKIHNYFYHSFHVGNRFTKKEKKMVSVRNKQLANNDTNFTNESMLKTCEILKKKKILTKHINDRHNKYQQLDFYSCGCKFRYDGTGEEKEKSEQFVVYISPKFKSLKEELTKNEILSVGIQQVKSEFKKASVHYDSEYRKKYYPNMEIQHVQSLMIYCNFDNLQKRFSKTYWENNGNNHKYFFHLGQNLKIAVHIFGENITIYKHKNKKNITTYKYKSITKYKHFYHGINERLIFPEYIGNWQQGICILAPLSTSTSKEVAISFAHTNGMVIKFGGYKHYTETKYFSVSWISHFPRERECLFIQNYGICQGLEINNIHDICSGYEYHTILKALKIINFILFKTSDHDVTISNVDTHTDELICAIIDDELSPISPENHVPFNSLTEFGRQIIHNYFQSKTEIKMDCELLKCYSNLSLWNMFFRNDLEWIKLRDILLLCPHLEKIYIKTDWGNGQILHDIFDDIFQLLQHKIVANLKLIELECALNLQYLNKDLFVEWGNAYNIRFKKFHFSVENEPRFGLYRFAKIRPRETKDAFIFKLARDMRTAILVFIIVFVMCFQWHVNIWSELGQFVWYVPYVISFLFLPIHFGLLDVDVPKVQRVRIVSEVLILIFVHYVAEYGIATVSDEILTVYSNNISYMIQNDPLKYIFMFIFMAGIAPPFNMCTKSSCFSVSTLVICVVDVFIAYICYEILFAIPICVQYVYRAFAYILPTEQDLSDLKALCMVCYRICVEIPLTQHNYNVINMVQFWSLYQYGNSNEALYIYIDGIIARIIVICFTEEETIYPNPFVIVLFLYFNVNFNIWDLTDLRLSYNLVWCKSMHVILSSTDALVIWLAFNGFLIVKFAV
eukprot:352186_1